MKIVKLTAENFKRLVVAEITPTGNMVEITGKNGNGKTSVLDAIAVAIEGLSVAPPKPIRAGQDEARIIVDLGDLVVTRIFREGKTSTLRVENKDGVKLGSPQAVLDRLLGALSFDPLAFSRMDAKQQFDTLRRFVPDFDFDKTDALNAADFDRRTAVNRRIKDAQAQADATKPTAAGLPTARVDETALIAKLEQAGQHNTEIETRRAKRKEVSDKIAALGKLADHELASIRQHEEAIAACRVRFQSAQEEQAREQARLDAAPPLPEPIDTSIVRSEIEQARAVNAVVARHEQHLAHVQTVNKLREEAETLTAEIEKRNEQKRAAVAAAKLPVEGLAFGDGFVLMNGVPFSQASDAEQLRASIAMAMAMNPTLRVIRVRDGSLMDDDSMRLLSEMAQANDYQVWIERVDGSGKVGFVLEDGFVKQPQQETV